MPTLRQKLQFQMLLVFSRKIYGKGNTEIVLPLFITSFVSMVIPTHSEQTFLPLSNKEVEHEVVSYITDLGLKMQWEAEPGELWGTPSVMWLLPAFSRAREHLTPPRDYSQIDALRGDMYPSPQAAEKRATGWVTRDSSNNWLLTDALREAQLPGEVTYQQICPVTLQNLLVGFPMLGWAFIDMAVSKSAPCKPSLVLL